MEILRIREEHQFGVFEMGMNKPGEIRQLAALVEPGIAIITNIGTAHIGMIGSQDGIAAEKREIFSSFSGEETALIPSDSKYLEFLSKDLRGTVVPYDLETAGIQSVEAKGIDGTVLQCGEGEIHLRIPGRQMVANACAAISVARRLEVPFDAIRQGVENVEPVFGRSQVLRGPVTVIQDCYNANLESTTSALELLAETPTEGRRIAVLGAMKELGEMATEAHRTVAESAADLPIDQILLVGDEFRDALGATPLPRTTVFSYDQWEQVVAQAEQVVPGDVVLLKGSRSVALERLTPYLIEAEVAS
jgi:UDP-N-acetylmuramoyl-tripeptide--D-alanyl-D-alanine ligase